MAKSFFERLTGSVRVTDGVEIADEIATSVKKTTKLKEIKLKKEKPQPVAEESFAELEGGEVTLVKVPAAHESRMERRFFATRGEIPEPEKIIEEEAVELDGELTLDVLDEGTHFTVQAMVAGVHPEDIDISFNDDTFTIRGVRKQHHETHGKNYYAKELYWGKFSRSVVLPEEVDSEKVEANLKNGLLTVKIPKKSYGGTRKIKIKAE
ncbi:MAG: Hsp20/alpha crystallin family protein [bacterium]|nr:Hsp20/alpha crystallin family protein [bacterium]